MGQCAQAAVSTGIPAGLPVATPDGWVRAGALQVGEAVLCVDAPPQPIMTRRIAVLPCALLVRLPAGALGEHGLLLLPPDQPVALDLDAAADLYGDPVVLLPAGALVGWRGIARRRVTEAALVTLGFDRRQVVYAGPGMLLGCPGPAASVLRAEGPPAPPLTAPQARHLLACVMAADVGAALQPRPYATF